MVEGGLAGAMGLVLEGRGVEGLGGSIEGLGLLERGGGVLGAEAGVEVGVGSLGRRREGVRKRKGGKGERGAKKKKKP